MVWNNVATLFASITSVATSSTKSGILVCVVGSLDPSTNDPNSYTILLPNINSNEIFFADSGLLGGTYGSASLTRPQVPC
jgi:hypothetical protein